MTDPFGGAGFGGFDPRIFSEIPFFRELQKLMQWSGGPVNWELAGQTARAVAGSAERGAALPAATTAHDAGDLADAVGVAELWLDAVTDLPAVDGAVRAFSLTEWTQLAATSEGLGVYVEPVAAGMASAMAQSIPDELAGAAGPMMAQTMQSLGAMLYGLQMGMIAGNLAGQLLGTYDLGVPTIDPATVGTVGSALEQFGADYGFDPVELRHWLALQESAHRRQFAGVPWLRPHVAALISEFAAEADFNPNALMEQLGGLGIDPADPDAVQAALAGPEGFRVEPTTAQRRTLERLQVVVAFTDGWVGTVVEAAARDKLPSLPRIAEAVHRRRAEKGPGEQFLEQLIGLDLKPADLRQGRAFCAAVLEARGQGGLDRVWAAPTNLPSPAELAEPSRWLVRMAAGELGVDVDDAGGS